MFVGNYRAQGTLEGPFGKRAREKINRAQGTIEYLVIIGVVVVVALVVVGMLMSQASSVGETSNKVSKLGSVSGQFAVKDFVVGADGNAIIVLQNNSGGLVSIQSIGIGNTAGGFDDIQIASTGTQTFSLRDISGCDCTNLIGQNKNCDVNITFTSEDGLNKYTSLTLPVDCEQQATPTNSFVVNNCTANSDCATGETCIIGTDISKNKCYSGVAGYWRFNNNVVDSSGNGTDGNTEGDANVSSSGKLGNAYSSAGAGYANVPMPDFYPGSVSVNAWVYQTGLDGISNNISVVSADGGASYPNVAGGDWMLGMIYYGGSGNGSKYCFLLKAGTYITCSAPGSIELNKWVYLTGVYNSSTSNFYIYKDGLLVNSGVFDSSLTHQYHQVANIGHQYNAVDVNFTGKIDEVIIFNRALSASEVATLYTDQSGS